MLLYRLRYIAMLSFVDDTNGNTCVVRVQYGIFLRHLGSFRLQRYKERMWNLCVFRYWLHISCLVSIVSVAFPSPGTRKCEQKFHMPFSHAVSALNVSCQTWEKGCPVSGILF